MGRVSHSTSQLTSVRGGGGGGGGSSGVCACVCVHAYMRARARVCVCVDRYKGLETANSAHSACSPEAHL